MTYLLCSLALLGAFLAGYFIADGGNGPARLAVDTVLWRCFVALAFVAYVHLRIFLCIYFLWARIAAIANCGGRRRINRELP